MSGSYYHRRDRWRVRAGEWIVFALAWCFQRLTWPVPTWTLAGLCAPVGGAVALMLRGPRRRAERNLALVWPHLPAGARRRIVRGGGAHFARLAVEYCQLEKLAGEIELEVEGAEHLRAAREAGRGAVLVTAHFGNWEAIRLAALGLGCETGIIYRAFNNRYIDRYASVLIAGIGRPVMQKGRQGARQLLAHVDGGGFAMILVDQRNTGAPFVDFLGHPAETALAPAELARRTGAALIPARALRNVAARRFEVTFESPVTGDDAVAMMAEVNRRIGSWVEAAPEQWMWFHRRWRSTIMSRARPNWRAE